MLYLMLHVLRIKKIVKKMFVTFACFVNINMFLASVNVRIINCNNIHYNLKVSIVHKN